jgi:hypothetical protein
VKEERRSEAEIPPVVAGGNEAAIPPARLDDFCLPPPLLLRELTKDETDDEMGAHAATSVSLLGSCGLHAKHRPSRTSPGIVNGTILNSFFWKHF